VLRTSGTTDVGRYIRKFQQEVRYFVENGIDADPKGAELLGCQEEPH
jgi:hypothetical protein